MFNALQVQSWFRDKQAKSAAVVVPFKPKKRTEGLKTAMIKKRVKGSSFITVWSWTHWTENFLPFSDEEFCKFMPVPTIPASEAAVELQTLIFEAKSAKDSAWWAFNLCSYTFYFSSLSYLYIY